MISALSPSRCSCFFPHLLFILSYLKCKKNSLFHYVGASSVVLVFTVCIYFYLPHFSDLFYSPVFSFLSSSLNSCSAVSLWSVLRGTWNISHSSLLLSSAFFPPVVHPSISSSQSHTVSRLVRMWLVTLTQLHFKWPSKQLVCIMPWFAP